MLGPLAPKTYLLPSLDSATEMNFSTPLLFEEEEGLLEEEPPDDELPPLLEEPPEDDEAFLASESISAFMVTLPTLPSAERPLRFWNALTASSVSEP